MTDQNTSQPQQTQASDPGAGPAAAPTGVTRTTSTSGQTVGTQPAPGTATPEPPGPKAQTEIGPTTYSAGKAPVQHGENDPETKAAYAGGHPTEGIAAQRAKTAGQTTAQPQAFRPGQTNPEGATTHPQGTTAATTDGQHQAQQGDQQGQQRVRMLRDEAGRTAGQELELPAAEAQQLVANGAAQAI